MYENERPCVERARSLVAVGDIVGIASTAYLDEFEGFPAFQKGVSFELIVDPSRTYATIIASLDAQAYSPSRNRFTPFSQ